MAKSITLTIDGEEYVAVPKATYLSLVGDSPVDAMAFTLGALGRNLRAAREHAKLTQAQLAKKLKRTQSTVSQAEAGTIRVSEAYVVRVLKVCGLPEDWSATPSR